MLFFVLWRFLLHGQCAGVIWVVCDGNLGVLGRKTWEDRVGSGVGVRIRERMGRGGREKREEGVGVGERGVEWVKLVY